jgi:hypothetical protein
MFRPFRARGWDRLAQPRALPWAVSLGPVGAPEPSIRAVPCHWRALGRSTCARWGHGTRRRVLHRGPFVGLSTCTLVRGCRSEAPKGRDEIAQGKAKRHPGYHDTPHWFGALKGRNPIAGRPKTPGQHFALSGLHSSLGPGPRALPWAISLCPVGAPERDTERRLNRGMLNGPARLHAMHLESRAAFPSPAPKGRNEIAEGKAKRHPGYHDTPHWFGALKGRNPIAGLPKIPGQHFVRADTQGVALGCLIGPRWGPGAEHPCGAVPLAGVGAIHLCPLGPRGPDGGVLHRGPVVGAIHWCPAGAGLPIRSPKGTR